MNCIIIIIIIILFIASVRDNFYLGDPIVVTLINYSAFFFISWWVKISFLPSFLRQLSIINPLAPEFSLKF